MIATTKNPSLVMRGRIGGFRLAATRDSRVTSAPGRAAFMASFAREVDPDGVLPPAERERRAAAAKRAHFAAMAYRSAQVRAMKAATPPAVGLVGQ